MGENDPRPGAAHGLNEKILFWASFLTLIAAGMGFSIRTDIIADWGKDFGFTQAQAAKRLGRVFKIIFPQKLNKFRSA